MKILYSCLSKSWGGLEMFTITAVDKLLERGIETELLCYPNSKIEEAAKAKKIIVHTSKSDGYFHPINVFKLANLIKEKGYDLVHTQASKDLWILSPALFLTAKNIPLFLTKQMGSYIVKKDFLHKLIYSKVTTAFAISMVIEKNLLETCPLKQNQIKLLHNAVDTKKFDPEKFSRLNVRNEFNIADSEILIGMLARFSKGKGHEEFLKSAKLLCEKHENLKFMIVGEPSRGEQEYGNSIKSLCKELNLDKNVIFTGFRSDIPNILAALDIFIFPSHNEAFGIALAEALSMGIPSVVANSDGPLDIAVDNFTSFFFETKNSDDLSSKTEQLINSKELRMKFSLNSRKRAIEFFDLEVLTDKVISFYNEALSKKK